ncbi:hypothetical protein [Flavobacterium mekongense]|uniref:hypothetical protein n=1 Tax=Flavobacterium mekongense TaxID=3379707 RepID=UPI003999738C
MEKLYSSTTFLNKYLLPIVLIIMVIVISYIGIVSEMWIMLVIALMLSAILFSVFYNFYFQLKYVFIDETQKRLIIKHKGKEIKVSFDDIIRFEQIKIFSILMTVKLRKEFEFGDEIVFVPKNTHTIFSNNLEKRLNRLISK